MEDPKLIPGPEAAALVPKLRKALMHPKKATRRLAERALKALKMDKEAANAVPELRRALKDDADYVRTAAVDALGRLDKEAAAPAMQDLIDLLDGRLYDKSPGAAAEVLGRLFAKEAGSAIPSLMRAMDMRPPWLDRAAAAVGSIGREDPDLVLPELLRILKNHNSRDGYYFDTQGAALKALGIMGGAAAPALPTIRQLLSGKFSQYVRVRAIECLAQMGDTSDIPDLLQILREDVLVNRQYRVGVAATKALGAMAKKATSAIPELRQILKLELEKKAKLRSFRGEHYVALKAAAARTLAAMGKDAAPALAELRDGLKSRYPDFKESCAKALQVIGAEATRNSVCCCINRKCSWKEYGSTGLLAVNHSAGTEDGRCCKFYTGKCTRGYKSLLKKAPEVQPDFQACQVRPARPAGPAPASWLKAFFGVEFKAHSHVLDGSEESRPVPYDI